MMGISAGRFKRKRVSDPPVHRVRRTFGPHDGEIASVRRFVRDTLLRWNFEYLDVELVANELATNALVHGRSRFTVTLEESGGTATVAVSDGNRGPAFIVSAAIYSTWGRGMLIVAQVAKRWGSELARSGGKTVWAEVDVVRPVTPLVGATGRGAATPRLVEAQPATTAG